jgi:lactoylglutathione lyase
MEYKMVHTCYRVFDLDKSLDFYKNALNFKESRRKDFPEHGFTLVYLKASETEFELELTYNYDPEVPYEIGTGYGHLALTTPDLVGSHKAHEEAGYKVTQLKGLPGSPPRYYFITDPDGYKIEIIVAD